MVKTCLCVSTLVFASSIIAFGAELDLTLASVKAQQEQKPIWNGYTVVRNAVGKSGATAAEIEPPYPILVGKFAVARFQGADASWDGYDTLIIQARCKGEGVVQFTLGERDDEGEEAYFVETKNLAPGRHTLRLRLVAAPAGDLAPTAKVGDGAWNPDDEHGVELILAGYPEGFVIESLRLEKSASVDEGDR